MGRSKAGRLEKDAPIAIVGCGIAGLSTAISLLQAGFTNVSVLERDADPTTRREGFGLTLTYNPKGPLARLGILEEVAQRDCPSRSHYIFDPQGRVLGYYGNAFHSANQRGFGQRGNLRCPRQVLQRIMTDRFLELAKETKASARIYWGHTLADMQHLENGKVQLHFKNTQSTTPTISNTPEEAMPQVFDLLIAADGVRSSVVQMLAPQCEPRPLNVMIILGISQGFHHPLLTERGFYTVGDGKHRLFTMPYQGDRYSSQRRIMWQLSYRYEDDDDKDSECKENCKDPAWLRDTVLRRCSNWHDPVPALIQSTPLATIWGTPLYDRAPKDIQQAFQPFSRILLVGDALHAMSPFKGQGANNALLDGPLIASLLPKSRVDAAVRNIWRELVARTDKVVQASREAAHFWHSTACIPRRQQDPQQQLCQFAGVKEDSYNDLIHELSQRNITSSLAASLDATIGRVIDEMGIREVDDKAFSTTEETNVDPALASEILSLAAQGATAKLRNLSLTNAPAVKWARDEEGRSGLHVASKSGHYATCRWLLNEAQVDPWHTDEQGRSALDEASDPEVKSLFLRLQ